MTMVVAFQRFTPELPVFLAEWREHNSREWFQAYRGEDKAPYTTHCTPEFPDFCIDAFSRVAHVQQWLVEALPA